ncbi:ABC transporter permease [Glycomyces harbinensis]|uniref:ABC-2 type transport system permease protein n=1 Tax=Glycomyces harbinensis TaxID=58114 RepID=A0A1G7C3C1_9ACTN|nr:ABC transporter permease [Glycomyces harbinensis]SDE33763.1 ABC-2 type transport system permease protein [Glycomyces harbinensis]
MSSLMKLVQTETRLFVRDPTSLIVGLVLPTLILVGLGAVPMLREPSPDMDGIRFIDYFMPSLIVMSVGVVGLTNLPSIMATYRERGILRRMRTTPMHPGNLLLAQLTVNLGAALAATVLVVATGRIVYGVPLPEHALGFTAAFILGIAAVFSIGMLVAALAPTTRAATGIASMLFMAVMFFGGVYLPRFMLPDAIARIGEYVPPGVQTLLDSWNGEAPAAAQLLAMGATAVVAGVLAARMFKWE